LDDNNPSTYLFGGAVGPGYTLIRLQALHSLAGIRFYPYRMLSELEFFVFNCFLNSTQEG